MTDHFEKHFPIYLISALGIVLALLLWTSAWEKKARQRAETYCQEHLMVLVDTPAGERCAPLWALERTTR